MVLISAEDAGSLGFQKYAMQRDYLLQLRNVLDCVGVRAYVVSEWVISKFNGTSTPKGSYSAKAGLNCQVTSWKKSSNEQGNVHYGPRPAKV